MFYITLIIGLILDFISKYLAVTYLQEKVSILGDFFYLQQIYNSGIAFGMKIPLPLLKVGSIALIIGIYYYYKSEYKGEKDKKKQKLLDVSFGLIIAGAIGNGIERVFNEQVIDFIGVKYFAIFNLADSFISIGAILLLYYYFKQK